MKVFFNIFLFSMKRIHHNASLGTLFSKQMTDLELCIKGYLLYVS